MPGGDSITHLAGNVKAEMFDFLNKKDSYLTFGSNAPYTITYTSSKSETLSLSASLSTLEDATSSIGFSGNTLLLVFDVVGSYDTSKGQNFAISDTKSSTKSHGTENTISITFADDDLEVS